MTSEALVHRLIVLLDSKISEQLSAIMHHKAVLSLEASWRGLWFMIQSVPVMHMADIKLRLLPLSLLELTRDCTRASDFDQSCLFDKIYSSEFDHAGGEPFGLLVYDFYFNLHGAVDWIELADFIANISSAAFAPALLGVSPQFFGLDCFSEMEPDIDIARTLEQSEYSRYLRLRKNEDTRFINLVLPRMLLHTDQHNRSVWGNPIYYLARTAIECFAANGWFTRMRQRALTHPGKPLSFDTVLQDMRSSLEASIADAMEATLSLSGLITVMEYVFSNDLGFRSLQSLHEPNQYVQEDLSANALLSTMMPYLLCACRFAHYMKVMVRDKVGQFDGASNLERYLQNWVFQYCGKVDAGNDHQLAKYPLQNAKIKVVEHKMKPGQYACEFDIQPNFHIEQVSSQLHFVSHLGRV